MRHQYTLIKVDTIKNTDQTHVGEDVEELELSCTTHENKKNGKIILVKSLTISSKSNHLSCDSSLK